ncbi:hypothetical protein GN958_ATG02727 [Phytophthora infestans]|uniref:Uncharacterized protein n=1 Tax=Phytophthora infestans TaxID=4787 RepID=A0A8S9V4K0_PHYIN|nr:hypothetical protein GN958_ATG22030 [Phytophthora infestans]KAF4148085.1 hypothetical protein GN958_ATG02727 [Phytophthora infestans]
MLLRKGSQAVSPGGPKSGRLARQPLSEPTKDGDVELKGVLELKAADVITPLPHSDVWLRIRQKEGPAGKNYKLDLKALNLQERQE